MGFVAVRWRLGGLEIGRRKRRRPTVGKRIGRIGSKGVEFRGGARFRLHELGWAVFYI